MARRRSGPDARAEVVERVAYRPSGTEPKLKLYGSVEDLIDAAAGWAGLT